MQGISVIICCHNGAVRLPTALAHLMTQESVPAPWEVLLVDNGSTDSTTKVARSCWRNGPAPLRIVSESRLGLCYARERGLVEARYDFLGFVDDDNWVSRDWVRTAYEILTTDSNLGAVGSIRPPASDLCPPSWFDDFHSTYAVLTEHDLRKIRQPPDHLPGAGLCVRKAAWEGLVQNGYHPQLSGRKGKKLQGGEDAELTMAIRLSGWNLRFDRRLSLQHFMATERLRWTYLRKLLRNYGASQVLLDAYTKHSLSLQSGFQRWLSDRWWYQFGRTLARVASRPRAVMAALLSAGEGQTEVAEIETQFGRALGLLRSNKRYSALRRDVRNASWRTPSDHFGQIPMAVRSRH
jgi:glycosyltransferase involved in cell wall biosynthesis